MAISNIFSKAAGPMVTRFYIEPCEAEGTNLCSNSLGHVNNMVAMLVDSKHLLKYSNLEPMDR